MAKVTLMFGTDPQGEFNLEKEEYRIGRARDSDIPIDNLGVSRHHCSIVKAGEGWKVVDKGSNNGTFINGAQVHEQVLKHEDRIILGKYSLVFDAFGYAASGASSQAEAGGSKKPAGMGAEMTMFMDPEAIAKMQAQLKSGGGQVERMILSVTQGGRELNCPLIKKETSIGKGVEADVPVQGFLVKAIQAKVVKTDKGYEILSCGGWRGVQVNSKKVGAQPLPLAPGDHIVIAGKTIVFKKA